MSLWCCFYQLIWQNIQIFSVCHVHRNKPSANFNSDQFLVTCNLIPYSNIYTFVGHPRQQNCPMNWVLFFRVFVRSQRKISGLPDHFFLIFCLMLDSHKVRKLTKSDFWKKISVGQEGPKSPKKWSKNEVVRVWTKIQCIHMQFFILISKYKWFLNFLEKP